MPLSALSTAHRLASLWELPGQESDAVVAAVAGPGCRRRVRDWSSEEDSDDDDED